ncbi:DUF4097 family beta strand repeat-containing protein [Terrisporobacter sp.]
MDDKKWIQIRIITWSIVAILLSVVLIVAVRGWGSSIFTKEFTISNKKVVKELEFDDIDNLKNIKINFGTSNLIISESDEDNIQIIVKSNRKLKNKKYIDTNINSETLTIEDFNENSRKNFLNIFDKCILKVELKIPKSYNKNLTIDNKIGDITFDSNLNLNNLNVNIKTGDINVNKEIDAKRIDINSIVGDMKFDKIEGESISIKGKTGGVDIDKLIGYGSIESQIGDITCSIEDLNGDIDFKSHVGDIHLDVNEDLKFVLEGNKNIGDIKTNLEFSNISQSSKTFSDSMEKMPRIK